MKVCRDKRVGWTSKLILSALQNNARECLAYAIENGCPFPSNFDIDTLVSTSPGIEGETFRMVIEAGYFPRTETQKLIIDSIVKHDNDISLLLLIIEKGRIQGRLQRGMMPVWLYAIGERNFVLLDLLYASTKENE